MSEGFWLWRELRPFGLVREATYARCRLPGRGRLANRRSSRLGDNDGAGFTRWRSELIRQQCNLITENGRNKKQFSSAGKLCVECERFSRRRGTESVDSSVRPIP